LYGDSRQAALGGHRKVAVSRMTAAGQDLAGLGRQGWTIAILRGFRAADWIAVQGMESSKKVQSFRHGQRVPVFVWPCSRSHAGTSTLFGRVRADLASRQGLQIGEQTRS
jgi:hypothetical protein